MKNNKKRINRIKGTLATALFGALALSSCDSRTNIQEQQQKILAAEYNCGVIVGKEHYVGGYYSQQDKALIRESMRPKEHYFIPEDIPKTSVFAVDLNDDGRDDIQKVQTLFGRAMYNVKYIDLCDSP